MLFVGEKKLVGKVAPGELKLLGHCLADPEAESYKIGYSFGAQPV